MSGVLARMLARLLDSDVGIGWSKVTDAAGLMPQEAPAVARAIPKRRAEFAAGRRAARMALTGLGHPAVAIPVGEARAPLWPDGIRGAITHDMGLALAAVTQADAGLGLDLTEAVPLPGETRQTVLPHSAEARLGPLDARVGFSAKESLFKALFPYVGTYFGFDAALVRPDLHADCFEISLTRALGPFPADACWTGHVLRTEDRLLTALLVTPGA